MGVRLDAGPPDWDEVAGLVTDAFVRVAPKRLGALLAGRGA